MKITPQPQVPSFDATWAAQRLVAAGVCLVDGDTGEPIGCGERFFLEYALPLLRRGEGARRVPGCVELGGTRSRCRSLPHGLVAAERTVEADGRSRRLLLVAKGDTFCQAAAERAAPLCGLPAEDAVTFAQHLPAHGVVSLLTISDNLDALTAPDREGAARQIELQSLTGQLSVAYEELSLVYNLGGGMRVNRKVDDFLRQACGDVAGVLGVRAAGIAVWDDSLESREPVVSGPLALPRAVLGRLVATCRSLLDEHGEFIENNCPARVELSWLDGTATQLLAVPIARHGAVLGCAFALDKDVPPQIFGTFNDGVFTSVERKLLGGVATQVAIFLENAKLFRGQKSLMMGLLTSLVAAVDAKDAYTRGHSQRVALYARRLAEAAGYDAAYCERVYLSGLLHDVGKIGVDDTVLRKPGRLTEEEFGQIKLHPEIGYRILRGITQMEDLLPGVLYHHEKYNGRGYPEGRAGDNIPILGRIMCIADSFDAMTSSRTYRGALPFAVAMAEIQQCKGTQFDPILAELFARLPEGELLALAESHRSCDVLPVELISQVA